MRFVCTAKGCGAAHRYRPAMGCRRCGEKDKLRVNLKEALHEANMLVRLLRPACERIDIAGSICRSKAMIKDIEIVAQPLMIPDSTRLFEDEQVSALTKHIARLTAADDSELTYDPELRRDGPKYKRLLWGQRKPVAQTIAVDLFIVVPPATWGVIKAVRTGPADFSQLLVTTRSRGGACPGHLHVRDGALWDGNEQVDTPEESDFFAALDVPAWSPESRTAEKLSAHIQIERTRNHAGVRT